MGREVSAGSGHSSVLAAQVAKGATNGAVVGNPGGVSVRFTPLQACARVPQRRLADSLRRSDLSPNSPSLGAAEQSSSSVRKTRPK